MKRDIFKLFCLTFFLMVGVNGKAQQTSLTIDNQTPGWLSSKIGYGDQQTVENLKVIGYLNNEDLRFIARLMKENSLHGRLDLEEANFISTTGGANNYLDLDNDVWGASSLTSPSFHLQFLSLPQTLENGQQSAMIKLEIDTLFINTTTGFANALLAKVKHVKIGDNVTNLTYPALSDFAPHPSGSIEFPSTLKEIRETWNSSKSYHTISCKIRSGKNLKVFPSLERLIASLSIEEMPDSVFLPNIKVLSLDQYHSYKADRMFKSGMHVFIGEKIEKVTEMSHAKRIHLHFASSQPPVMEGSMTYHYQPDNESYFVLHVPMGSAAAYRACFKDGGTKVTIIEDIIKVTDVSLDTHDVSLNVGETYTLSAVVFPEEASNKSVNWISDNPEVAVVNISGVVSAKKSGKAYIIVSSVSNPEIKDSCEVSVTAPVAVTGITLNYNSLQFDYIGETAYLEATVLPEDATNKKVKWTSSDESVCIVSNGMIVAVGMGTSVVIATTEDGGFMAICIVTVTSATDISSVEQDEGGIFQVFDINGAKRTHLQKGINIIQFKDGTRKKVMIK